MTPSTVHCDSYRIYRLLSGYKVGGQKSVLEIWVTPAELHNIRTLLNKWLDTADRLHILRLDLRMQVRCYDIANPRRLGRLYRFLCKQAIPLQYSVFLFNGDGRQLERCMQEAIKLIDEKQDDLRAYPLPKHGLTLRIGRPILPDGIYWGGLSAEWQCDTCSNMA